ncbi:MAG: histidinol-phosphatase [Candidatus Nanopelagicales bacterium]
MPTVDDTLTGPYAADLALALRLADRADRITLRRFRAADLYAETKPDSTPVTEADRDVEVAVRSVLAEDRPDDAILGEEYGVVGPSDARRRWVVDPVDGTKNYLRGVPVWATLVALLDRDEVVVGVASAPALGRRWWAARDAGAWMTEAWEASGEPRRLRVSGVTDLADASFSYSDPVGWAERGADDGLRALVAGCWRTRAYGDFWSHVLVAEGVVDIAAEPVLGPWDIAALVPIVTEAGGRITAYDGGPALAGASAVSTNGHLHGGVLELLRTG